MLKNAKLICTTLATGEGNRVIGPKVVDFFRSGPVNPHFVQCCCVNLTPDPGWNSEIGACCSKLTAKSTPYLSKQKFRGHNFSCIVWRAAKHATNAIPQVYAIIIKKKKNITYTHTDKVHSCIHLQDKEINSAFWIQCMPDKMARKV